MAEPKKRTNKSKTGMRRMHIKAITPSIVYCSNCHDPMLRHNVCKSCGFYKGKKVFDIEIKERVKTESEGSDSK